MTTISNAPNLVNGANTVVDTVYDYIYSDDLTASFIYMNGGLTKENLSGYPSPTYNLGYRHTKHGELVYGSMVGATLTQTWFSLFYTNDDTLASDYIPIPGCSQTFYTRENTKTVIVNWMLTLGFDFYDSSNDDGVSLVLLVDGVLTPHTKRELARSRYISGGGASRLPYRDRFFGGHHAITSPTEGEHTISLALHLNGDPTALASPVDGLLTTRIRRRNLSVIQFAGVAET